MLSPRRLNGHARRLNGMLMTRCKEDVCPCVLKNGTLHVLELIFASMGLRCKLCGRNTNASNADKALRPKIQKLSYPSTSRMKII